MKNNYHLCLNPREKKHFSLPAKWNVTHFVEAGEEAVAPDVRNLTQRALLAPLGTPPFKDLVKKARKIAIIVDDKTRPTPAAQILPVLLSEIAEAGLKEEDVTIVLALGTHAAMNDKELGEKLGSGVKERYNVVQHGARQDDLVPVKLPGEDGIVRINRAVAQADLRIGISSILPHPMAGYGGGPKIVMPGICDFEYVRKHHMKYTIHPASKGGLTEGNPFHESCMRIARAIGLDFSINCVYDQHAQLSSITGGSLEGAFSRAISLCFEKLGHRFSEKVDITITSTYPHTHGHQFVKALSIPDAITKETGAILMFVPLMAPMIPEFIAAFDIVRQRSGGNSARYMAKAMSKGEAFLPDKPLEFNMAMKCVVLRPPVRTILVSPFITEEEAAAMGFEHASSLDAGIGLLEKTYPEAQVAIFPSGGLIVPIPEEKA